MGRATVNMGDKEVTGGFMLPRGEYDLKIVEAVLGKSKNGDPMATINYAVVNGLEHEGKSLKFQRVTFIQNDGIGAWIAKSFLKSLGLPYKGDNVNIDTDEWLGKVLHAKVGVREYEGKEYNEIKEFSAYEGPEIKKSDDMDVPF